MLVCKERRLEMRKRSRGKADAKDEMRERIRQERKIELVFENHRWFDLIRWGIAEEVLNGYVPHGIKVERKPGAPTHEEKPQLFEQDMLTFTPFEVLGPNARLPTCRGPDEGEEKNPTQQAVAQCTATHVQRAGRRRRKKKQHNRRWHIARLPPCIRPLLVVLDFFFNSVRPSARGEPCIRPLLAVLGFFLLLCQALYTWGAVQRVGGLVVLPLYVRSRAEGR